MVYPKSQNYSSDYDLDPSNLSECIAKDDLPKEPDLIPGVFHDE